MKERKRGFQKGSVKWCLTNDDWSDLTIPEIAEVLGFSEHSISSKISELKNSGIIVPYKKMKPRRKKDI